MGKLDDLENIKKLQFANKEDYVQQENTLDLLNGIKRGPIPAKTKEKKLPNTAAGVIAKQPLERFTLRLDKRLKEDVDILAIVEARSANTICAVAIREYVDTLENRKKIENYKEVYLRK